MTVGEDEVEDEDCCEVIVAAPELDDGVGVALGLALVSGGRVPDDGGCESVGAEGDAVGVEVGKL